MFDATAGVSPCHAASTWHTTSLTPMAAPAATTLSLKLPTTLQQSVCVGAADFWARLALLFDETKLLVPSDWTPVCDPRRICVTAFQRWLTSHVGELQRVEVSFFICGELDQYDLFNRDEIISTRNLDGRQRHAVFALETDITSRFPVYDLEPILSRLNKAVPGFGEALLNLILEAGWRTVPITTPAWAFDHISTWYWDGATSQDVVVAHQCAEHNVTPEELNQEGYYTPAYFEQSTPRWVLQPRRRFSARQWAKLTTHANGEIRTVSSAAHEVARRLRPDRNLMDDGGIETQIVGVACCLRWNRDDPVVQVHDDLLQDCMNHGEYTEVTGLAIVPMDLVSMRRSLRKLQRGFTHLRALDGLVALVSTRAT